MAQLPSGWQPVNCKPPMCNPFVHTFDTAVQVFPSSGGWFDGGLDFPVPTGPMGQGVRFPLSGGMFAGRQPIGFNYGQHINPIVPFKNYKPDKNNPKQPIGSNVDPFESVQQLRTPQDKLEDVRSDNILRSRQQQRPSGTPTKTHSSSANRSGSAAPGTLPLIKPPPLPSQ